MKGGKKCRDKRIDAAVVYRVNLGQRNVRAPLPNLNVDQTKKREQKSGLEVSTQDVLKAYTFSFCKRRKWKPPYA